MSLYDIYVISPPMAVAIVGILVILLDLVTQRKRLLPLFALVGLIAPTVLLVFQLQDLMDTRDLLSASEALVDGKESVLLGSLVVDRFALFFGFLVLAATALVVLASVEYVDQMERRHGEYYGLVLFSATGMILLASASELITIYISLELTTLPIVALAAFQSSSKSSEAGMKFLVIGAISSAIMLYGMALVFGFAQTTDLTGIAARVADTTGGLSTDNYVLLVGVVLMVAGFGFKISSAPFQMWVPDIYEGAPTPVVAFLSVASKAAAFAVLIRVFYTGFFDVGMDWGVLMAILAAASMIVGNLVAMSQSNIRRLFGYSTIAHAGYILVGVAAGVQGTADGSTGYVPVGPNSVLFYLGAYTAANLTAFFAIIAIGSRIGSDQIEDYAGIARRSPVLAVVLAPGVGRTYRRPADRHIYCETLHLYRRREGRPGLAGDNRSYQQRRIRVLLRSNHPGHVPGSAGLRRTDTPFTRFLGCPNRIWSFDVVDGHRAGVCASGGGDRRFSPGGAAMIQGRVDTNSKPVLDCACSRAGVARGRSPSLPGTISVQTLYE